MLELWLAVWCWCAASQKKINCSTMLRHGNLWITSPGQTINTHAIPQDIYLIMKKNNVLQVPAQPQFSYIINSALHLVFSVSWIHAAILDLFARAGIQLKNAHGKKSCCVRLSETVRICRLYRRDLFDTIHEFAINVVASFQKMTLVWAVLEHQRLDPISVEMCSSVTFPWVAMSSSCFRSTLQEDSVSRCIELRCCS